MSAFLGPIHYWLYHKISLQEELIQYMLKASLANNWDSNLEQKVDTAYGKTDIRPLESIIDQKNIHGWLQEKIAQTEARLAFAVTKLLEQKPDCLPELKQTAYAFGQTHAVPKHSNADDAYQFLNDSLLDGMPCDRVNEILETGKEQTTWRQTRCVHHDYWNQVGGAISVYYELRCKIIEGMLSKSSLVFISNDDGFNMIKRK
ncbi:hypothetical protein V6615_14960 [Oscillospiraceae bacterium PP1C4]